MGELALVGDHSTVPLTRVSCHTVFSKSQKTRKAGTLCMFCLENDMDNWKYDVLFDSQEAEHYLEFNDPERTFDIRQE